MIRKLARGGSLLAAGYGTSQFLGLLKNFLVARVISPEEFGITALLTIFLSVIEAMTDIGWDKFLVQSPLGRKDAILATIHFMNIGRGLLICICLFVSAPFLAVSFHAPEAIQSFQLLAVVPFLKGFMHLEVKRMHRELRFGPDVSCVMVSQLVGVLFAILLSLYTEDHRGVLFALIIQSVVLLGLTHFVSTAPYRAIVDFENAKIVLTFGWPLLLNGFVMVLAAQGDRLLVGRSFGPETLATYFAATLLIGTPCLLMTKVSGSVFFPWLAERQNNINELARRHAAVALAASIAAILVYVPLVLLGQFAMAIVFGEHYRISSILVVCLAMVFTIRFFRFWPITTSVSLGDTKSVLLANIVRLIGLALGGIFIYSGGSIIELVICITFGEISSLIFSIYRVEKHNRVPSVGNSVPIAVTLCTLLLTSFFYVNVGYQSGIVFLFVLAAAIVIFSILVLLLTSPITSTYFRKLKRSDS